MQPKAAQLSWRKGVKFHSAILGALRKLWPHAAILIAFMCGVFGFYRWIGGRPLSSHGPPDVAALDIKRLHDMSDLQNALDAYYRAENRYPDMPAPVNCAAPYNNVGGLSALLVPKFTPRVPTDPEPSPCEYNYFYWSDSKNFVVRVRLSMINESRYADHMCIGASGGVIPPEFKPWPRCPTVTELEDALAIYR